MASHLSVRKKVHVNFNGIPSKIRPFRDGVPQGSVLSSTLFNLFLHDISIPTSQYTKILSYADNITIKSTHAKHNTAATNTEHYLNRLQTYLTANRLKLSPEKSTATFITNYKQEYNLTPVTLYNTPIPYTNKVKILGVTYDNSLTFKDHIADIKLRCTPELRALKAIRARTLDRARRQPPPSTNS